ncbi:MAG: NAD(P)/FAD-dependent oxidoreductase [Chloroflexi bacterium]|nr:NAD(P)/FAD-dependent oxidoreductase [Chloroflexota bacterium]
MPHYDALIVGAGIAGLTAAATLARGGARVAVCEQAERTGGLLNSFRRQGYLFDGGIKALENAGLILPTLEQLGVLDEVRLVKSPIALLTQQHVQPIRTQADLEAYFAHLAGLFPDEHAGLQTIRADALRIFQLLGALLRFPNLFARDSAERVTPGEWFKGHGRALSRAPRTLGLLKRTLRAYCEEHVQDAALVNLLCDVFPEGTTAFFGLGYFGIFLDYYYPADGMQAIPRALTDAILAAEGEVFTGALVERITLDNGRATGVHLADGRELRAGYIVSAGDARRLCTRLLPAGALPASFTDPLLRARPAHTVMQVFIGLDLPPERLGFEGCGHVFYAPDLQGITEQDRLTRPDYFMHVPQEISVPCLHHADLAPAGKTGLILSAMTKWEYGNGWGLRDGQPTEQHGELRERAARELIASFEQYYPDLSRHIEFRIPSAPLAVYEHSLNDEGSIMGWSYDQRETWNRGGLMHIRRAVTTPIPNLMLAGHWAFSPGGSPTAVLTAKLAADQILHATHPR